jgi:DGQHR domain-containing protein
VAKSSHSIQRISVIVPKNPFVSKELKDKHHCLCALNVDQLMKLWPGLPHLPQRNAQKVKAIQRSLDWKRVAQIAAYLLQEEIIDAPDKIDLYFKEIYEPKKNEPGRQWPPSVNRFVGFQPSEFPTFSNILIHVNGARIEKVALPNGEEGAADLIFDEDDPKLNFSVIDGQHRINGAHLALCILREKIPGSIWQIPSEIFLDLDPVIGPPTHQAQIFIDVNFYQKKVDKSLVADLFPTARGFRESLNQKERAQDIGRKLMLERGPLVGMIQIPGIRYGVKDVITLSTLNSAIESVLDDMEKFEILGFELQTDFLAQCLNAWFEASGRFENKKGKAKTDLDPQNVVYQGRILVSVIDLIPAMIWKLKKSKVQIVSDKAVKYLTDWLKEVITNANLMEKGIFIDKNKFKSLGYLGSGGIGRFRDSLWAVVVEDRKLGRIHSDKIALLAKKKRDIVWSDLSKIK